MPPTKPVTLTQGSTYYNPNTGKAEGTVQFDTQTGKRLSAGQTTLFNPMIPTTINGGALGTTTTPVIPPPRTNNTANNNLQSAVDTTFTGTQTQGKDGSVVTTFADGTSNAPINPQETAQKGLLAAIRKLGTKGARTNEIQEEEGVAAKKAAVRNIETEAMALDKSFQRRVDALLGSGAMTREQAAPQIAELQRMQNSQKADLAIQYKVAQGAYSDAFEIAKAKVEAEFEPIDAEIEAYKTQIDLFQHNMTDKEKFEAQAILEEKQAQRDFGFQKQLLAYKASIDRASGGGNGKIVNINGVDYIQNADGSFSTPKVPGSDQGTSNAQEQIDAISVLLGNTKGLKASVGTTALFGRGGNYDFGSARGEFQAGIQQLTSQLTLDNLISAKARGATFGALSQGELNILAGGATKLNTWAKKDKNGNIVGFKTSEANVRRELDKIANFAKKDFILKGGDPATVGAQVLPDGVWVQNSDGSFTKL